MEEEAIASPETQSIAIKCATIQRTAIQHIVTQSLAMHSTAIQSKAIQCIAIAIDSIAAIQHINQSIAICIISIQGIAAKVDKLTSYE